MNIDLNLYFMLPFMLALFGSFAAYWVLSEHTAVDRVLELLHLKGAGGHEERDNGC